MWKRVSAHFLPLTSWVWLFAEQWVCQETWPCLFKFHMQVQSCIQCITKLLGNEDYYSKICPVFVLCIKGKKKLTCIIRTRIHHRSLQPWSRQLLGISSRYWAWGLKKKKKKKVVITMTCDIISIRSSWRTSISDKLLWKAWFYFQLGSLCFICIYS